MPPMVDAGTYAAPRMVGATGEPRHRVAAFEATSALEQRFEREALPHQQVLYATACRLMRDPADAEDLVQETFLRAYRGFASYTPETNIRAWLFTILHRARTDQFRKVGRSPRTVALLDQGPSVAPAQECLARGQEELARALANLPEPFRTAVVLRDVQDFSYHEIAQITRVPAGTVMSRIHRGRAQLRETLAALRPPTATPI
jgi:RNA polymerase sigma-70 factor (ECF subfamily)